MTRPWPTPPSVPRPQVVAPSPALSDVVHGELFARRIIMVRGVLDAQRASDAAAELMTLDALGDERIDLYLQSPGGPLEAAFTLMDTIDLVGVPVHVTCIGAVEASAVGVLAVGTHRRISPHARLRLVEPVATLQGRAADIERGADQHQQQLRQFQERLASATGRPVQHVEAAMRAGLYLDAAAALAHGLADEIVPVRREYRWHG